MNTEVLLTALDLPANSLVDQRIPKKLLLENGAPTVTDKRHINDGIEELQWLAALKPTTVGVPAFRDASREYLEIAVLRLCLRADAKATRIVELVHRAIPYPVLLLTEQAGRTGVSAAHKRWSQGEAGKMVLEDAVVAVELDSARDGERWPAFREALAIGQQPRTTLYALYQGWLDTLIALNAAAVTGVFALAANAVDATARRIALQDSARLETEIATLRARAAKESQIKRQVEMNLQAQQLQCQLDLCKKAL